MIKFNSEMQIKVFPSRYFKEEYLVEELNVFLVDERIKKIFHFSGE